MSTRTECAVCGRELPAGQHEPCPGCGSTQRRHSIWLRATAVGTVALRWREIREYYERHPVLLPIAVVLTIGAPFLGRSSRACQVLVGLALSAVSFLAGLRGMTRGRREVERGP